MLAPGHLLDGAVLVEPDTWLLVLGVSVPVQNRRAVLLLERLALATLSAILSLSIARTEAGQVERDRTRPLAGIAPARTTGKAGICSRISQS